MHKGKRKRANENDYIQSKGKFTVDGFELFKDAWDNLEMQIDILKSDLNCQIFNDLVTFLKSCHGAIDKTEGRPSDEIPTAVLLTGVNTPDHRVMFSSLQSLMKDTVTPHVVSILSKDCGRFSSLIQTVLSQLTNTKVNDQDESFNEDFENQGMISSFNLKSVSKGTKSVSMLTLVKWYKDLEYFRNSKLQKGSKKSPVKHKNDSKPLIVIMFEDLENIQARILQDFISICSSYISKLPIIFVFGVATSMSAVHQLLPSSVSSLLCMEKFQAPPASQYLTHLMDKIIMTADVPFKLGPRVFHFLLDIFLYHNFSTMNFTLGFQYCMMEHFLSNSLSFLCVDYDDIEGTVHNLSRSQLVHVRQHPVFQR